MEALEALGYPILSQPHLGYRLGPQLPDILCADEIRARLVHAAIDWRPIVFKETSSTNNLVSREAQGNFPEGLVIVAERQTHGRGRQGRVWQSTKDLGLYFSVLLRPDWPLAQAARLTIVASLAVAEALEELSGTKIQIKWPNDLMVEGRKLGGILTEVQGEVESMRFAVVGIGINVGHTKSDFPKELQAMATSLGLISGQELRRVDVLVRILEKLTDHYREKFPVVRAAWEERCLSLGKLVQVQTSRGVRQGQALGLDEDGALMMRVESGKVERITSGDLF
jgi:BirA family biotin operon repressor/biotin-[acetyl-CoA-carboxylase] ligase